MWGRYDIIFLKKKLCINIYTLKIKPLSLLIFVVVIIGRKADILCMLTSKTTRTRGFFFNLKMKGI